MSRKQDREGKNPYEYKGLTRRGKKFTQRGILGEQKPVSRITPDGSPRSRFVHFREPSKIGSLTD